MNWWVTSQLPASAQTLTRHPVDSSQSGSDGIRQIKHSHDRKLLPLSEAINKEQTRLFERDIRSFVQAYSLSVKKSDPKPLMDWLNRHKVTEVNVERAIPTGPRGKSTSLRNRSVYLIKEETMKTVAEQFIKNHIRAQSMKDASGNSGASAKVAPVMASKRRRKSGKKTSADGDSGYISDRENVAPDSIDQREIEEGLDSIRNTPNSIIPPKESS